MGSRINDREADDLMAGRVPAGRPDLVGLAETISAVRTESRAVAAPVPSALLAAVLEGRDAVSPSSASGASVAPPSIVAAAGPPLGVVAALTKGVHAVKNWLTELELVSKVALGSGAFALAVSGVGVAGALPGQAQTAFDQVVSTVVPQEDEVDDDSILFDDDELEVDDGVTFDDDEAEVDDGSPREDDDEAEVDDGSPREDDDEAEVDDGSPREDDDEAEVDEGSPREDDDEAEVDEGSPREDDDEAEVDEGAPHEGDDDSGDEESDDDSDDDSDEESEAEVDED